MSFYGSSFSFDGVSCEEYGLMLYDFNNTSQGNSSYAKGMDISEDRIAGRVRSVFYGTEYKNPLEFKLVFGVNSEIAESGEDIDRQEMEVIGSWLTGHGSYKWLVIDQPDMEGIRYHCIITDLEVLEYAGNKWAFQCSVHCDSPYAYTVPMTFQYVVDSTLSEVLPSRSSINQKYMPKITIDLSDGGDFSIENTDTGCKFILANVPAASGLITLDSENGILSCESGINLYQFCNFEWPSLVRGDNHLNFEGNGVVTFVCEFPVNVGG